MKKLMLATLLVLIVFPAEATTGTDLVARCINSKDKFDIATCLWYVVGVADTAKGHNKGVKGHKFCLTYRTDRTKYRDVFVEYLKAHPRERYLPAPVLIANALSKEFPCK